MIGETFAPLGTPERLRAIARYDLADPRLRRQLDQVAERSATRLGMPTGMVSIVLDSAQFFVGSYGLDGWIARSEGTPVEWAFCAHAVLAEAPLYVVPDAIEHPTHRDSPLVTGEGTRAYAGAAIVDPDGQVIGMHCVVGEQPRSFGDEELGVLRTAAVEVGTILGGYRRDLD